VEAPILAYPDPAKEYILDTDANNHNVEAVLPQVQDGREVVVAYYSKALSASEKNYCTTRRELLAVVKAVKHFRPYLYERMFRLRTDHASLIWLVDGLNHQAKWRAGWKSWQSFLIRSNTDPVTNTVMLTDSAAARQMSVSNAKT